MSDPIGAFEYLPATQEVHAVEPANEEYEPEWQEVHSAEVSAGT